MPNRDSIVAIDDREPRIAALAVRLYAESHPRPTQVTQQQAAEMLGVSSATVRKYIEFGALKLNGCGRLPIEAIDAIRSSAFHERRTVTRRAPKPTAIQPDEEHPYTTFLKRRSRFGPR
jgi:hypothetical protein